MGVLLVESVTQQPSLQGFESPGCLGQEDFLFFVLFASHVLWIDHVCEQRCVC